MFLNTLGEPVALEDFDSKNLDTNAPLLLACPNPSIRSLPENWTGNLYTGRRIISALKRTDLLKFLELKRVIELEENKPTEIKFPDGTPISITAFVWSKAKIKPKLIFLLKDEYITRICADELANNLNSIISNNVLRKSIVNGIDIMHFNDNFAKGCNPKDSKFQHTWFRLHLLIYLIRPKKVCGLNDAALPQYIIQSCKKPDFNRFVCA